MHQKSPAKVTWESLQKLKPAPEVLLDFKRCDDLYRLSSMMDVGGKYARYGVPTDAWRDINGELYPCTNVAAFREKVVEYLTVAATWSPANAYKLACLRQFVLLVRDYKPSAFSEQMRIVRWASQTRCTWHSAKHLSFMSAYKLIPSGILHTINKRAECNRVAHRLFGKGNLLLGFIAPYRDDIESYLAAKQIPGLKGTHNFRSHHVSFPLKGYTIRSCQNSQQLLNTDGSWKYKTGAHVIYVGN